MSLKIIDISPTISRESAVWPGDKPFSRDVSLSQDSGHHLDLSSIDTTVHIGAHADAPNHFHPQGTGIDRVDLQAYIGPCYVHTVKKNKIEPEDCEVPLKQNAPRILFRTLSCPDPNFFNKNFSYFTPEAVKFMGQNKVKLIGIDTPSVDEFSSKDLPSHRYLYEYNIRNLEGLVLDDVDDGIYELIALPLKIKDCDASPVRAVLIS